MILGKVLLRVFLLLFVFFYACEGVPDKNNPCDGKCGKKASCRLKGSTPVCSCPLGMKGDPFKECVPTTDADLCKDDTCGFNAICKPGKNKKGIKVPVCSCPSGSKGDPFESCEED